MSVSNLSHFLDLLKQKKFILTLIAAKVSKRKEQTRKKEKNRLSFHFKSCQARKHNQKKWWGRRRIRGDLLSREENIYFLWSGKAAGKKEKNIENIWSGKKGRKLLSIKKYLQSMRREQTHFFPSKSAYVWVSWTRPSSSGNVRYR